MIDKDTLDKYFDPEHPWVRGLFTEDIVGLGIKLDDATSRKLATLTGWTPRDDMGHRYHNALVMMNIAPEDSMYYHMYDFVKGWGEKVKTLERCGIPGDHKNKCFEHFHLFQQFRRHNNKGLEVDDMLSIAILTELSKQGRRDLARAVVEKGKGTLEEEAFATTQKSPKGSEKATETKGAKESANRIGKKRLDRQKVLNKMAREITPVPQKASSSGTSTPARNSSPMSWTAPSSSGRGPPTNAESHSSGGKSHGLSRSALNTPAMTSRSRESPKTTQPKLNAVKTPAMTSRSSESPTTTQPERSAAKTPAMTPRSMESPKTTRPDRDSEGEDFESYVSRPRLRWDLEKELARMQRGAARSTARIGIADSPLAHKGGQRTLSDDDEATRNEWISSRSGQPTPNRIEARQALWKTRNQATPKPKAGAPDVTGDINQDDVPTESGDDSQEEHPSGDTGRRKQGAFAGDVTLSPTKRSKDSPSEHPPSPPKKSRVSSKLTDRSITPIGPIVIPDDDDDGGVDDGGVDDGGVDDGGVDDGGVDDGGGGDDDDWVFGQRQPDDTRPRRDTSSDEDPVPIPDI